MSPTVSVIIPTYQCAQYLPRAIESVLTQTYPAEKIETIVIDDGSTDDTAEVIRPYLSSVRYLYQPNAGVAAARNAGITASKGDYLAFLDADDYWLPARLDRLLEALANSERIIVTDDYYEERDGVLSEVSRFAKHVPFQFFLEPEQQYKEMLHFGFSNFTKTVMPRAALHAAGPYDESLRFFEDVDLALRCFAAGYALRIVAEPLEIYNIRAFGSVTRDYSVAAVADCLRVLLKHKHAARADDLSKTIGSLHYHIALDAFQRRSWRRAFRHGWKACANRSYVRSVVIPRLLQRLR